MIRVERGELADAEVEGIFRPVTSFGEPVSAAGRRIETRLGEALSRQMEALGEIPLGGAMITPARNLFADFLIHLAVQAPGEPTTEAVLERALTNGLRRASEWAMTGVALPPLASGPGNLDPEEGARILVDRLFAHLEGGSDPFTLVVVVEGDFEEELLRRLVRARSGEGG